MVRGEGGVGGRRIEGEMEKENMGGGKREKKRMSRTFQHLKKKRKKKIIRKWDTN